jgi:predicted transcriptional regulator
LGIDKRKIKIELEDAEGAKYNLSIEGNISKSKALKVFELFEMLDIKGKDNNYSERRQEQPRQHNFNNSIIEGKNNQLASIGARIWYIVENKFPYNVFTSSDVLEMYEHEFHEPIQLSMISTYLSRYSDKNRLSRTRKGKEWVYKIPRQTEMPTPLYEQPQPFSRPNLEHDFQSTDIN